MTDTELYQDAIEGIRKNVLEAIAVINSGYWGESGDDFDKAVRARSILRRIVPHDRATGKDLPTDLLKMQERAGQS